MEHHIFNSVNILQGYSITVKTLHDGVLFLCICVTAVGYCWLNSFDCTGLWITAVNFETCCQILGGRSFSVSIGAICYPW